MAAGAPVIPSVGDRASNHSKESKAYDTFTHVCELRESLWLFPRNRSKVCTCVARGGRAETLKPCTGNGSIQPTPQGPWQYGIHSLGLGRVVHAHNSSA